MTNAIRLLILLLPLYCVAATPSGVEPPPVDPCADAMTTAQMQACLGERYQEADGALNRAYRQAMEALDETRQAKLRAAQRAWIDFRDKSAEFEASVAEDGSLYQLIHLETLVAMTQERSRALAAVAASGD